MNREAWDRLAKLEEEHETAGGSISIGPALARKCDVCGLRVWRPKALPDSMCKCPKKEA